jgi:mannitol-specific phosphotransferase system IIBC component
MAVLESVALVASGTVLGAVISFLSQMITVRTQGEQLEKQLKAEKERTEATLRAERQSQLREEQLSAVAEVAALLEVTFRQRAGHSSPERERTSQ